MHLHTYMFHRQGLKIKWERKGKPFIYICLSMDCARWAHMINVLQQRLSQVRWSAIIWWFLMRSRDMMRSQKELVYSKYLAVYCDAMRAWHRANGCVCVCRATNVLHILCMRASHFILSQGRIASQYTACEYDNPCCDRIASRRVVSTNLIKVLRIFLLGMCVVDFLSHVMWPRCQRQSAGAR